MSFFRGTGSHSQQNMNQNNFEEILEEECEIEFEIGKTMKGKLMYVKYGGEIIWSKSDWSWAIAKLFSGVD